MWVRVIGRFEWQKAGMARWKSWLGGKGGNPSLRQGMVWNVECLEAGIEQGVGRKNNKRPREHKKSQPKSGGQNIRQV